MEGLARTEAASASLLLTLEGVATAAIAWLVFREPYGGRVAAGMSLIVAGALLLAWQGEPQTGALAGPLLIAGACLGWAIDNNLTRKVSAADPVEIAMWKGCAAGCVTLVLALARGAALPQAGDASAAGIVGFLGYGVSLALFVFALRHLGAARTSAYFSVAPFIGAAAAIPLLGEPFTLALAASGALIAAGVWLHINEAHAHAHVHEPTAHAHRHEHDPHHRHAHAPDDPPGEPHSHWHVHARLTHAHPHVPDIHHRHGH
jgi:drug/metabolite transporter (DMT)-like permease